MSTHAPHRSAPRTLDVPTWLALGIVLALALAARAWEAGRTPTWFDEIFTLRVARLAPGPLLRTLAGDMHPPLHFLLVHAWIGLGHGEAWAKALGVGVGALTVLALFGFARDLFGGGVAFFAALLLALHREHVYYSQEIRSYALLWLFYVCAAWMAWRWVAHGRRRDAVLYVLACAAALWTHYQAGFVLAFLGLWGVLALARTPRRLLGWAALHVAVALLFAPQLPTFAGQWARLGENHWLRPPTREALEDVFRLLAFRAGPATVPLLALAALAAVGRGRRAGAALLGMVFLLPILVAYQLSVQGMRLFLDRYMMFALPAWCALLAAGAVTVRPAWLRTAVVVALTGLAAVTLVRHPVHPESESLARATAWLERNARPGDVIVAGDTHSLFFVQEHAPELARTRLLVSPDGLPYYDGAVFVPDSIRVPLSAWDSLTAHTRWFGVRTRHGGVDTRPVLTEFLQHGRGHVEGFGLVTVVAGEP